MTPPLVSVCILNHERLDCLRRTLSSLRACTAYPNLEVVLLDDGSSPEVREQLPRLQGVDRLVLLDKVKDFCRMPSLVLEHTRGDYILHLENDWEFITSEPFIEHALDVCDSFPEVGCARLSLYPWNYWRSPKLPSSRLVESARYGLPVRLFEGEFRNEETDFGGNPFISPRERYASFVPTISTTAWGDFEYIWGLHFHERYSVGFIDGRGYCCHIGFDSSIGSGTGSGYAPVYTRLFQMQRQWLLWVKEFGCWSNPLLAWLRGTSDDAALADDRLRALRPSLFPSSTVVEVHHDEEGWSTPSRAIIRPVSKLAPIPLTATALEVVRLCDGERDVGQVSDRLDEEGRAALLTLLRDEILILEWARPAPGSHDGAGAAW